ncbi:hypothetical protein L7F22_037274 [Adiantum nelumboides]|nr:hypothetical protein [Adiantum nelumboides]
MAVIPDVPHSALLASKHILPALKSFWPTFQEHFAKHGGYLSLEAAKLYYARVDPLHTAIWICAFFSTFVYVTQQITGNASQVDRLWTFLPVIYTIHFTFQQSLASILDPPKLAGLFSSNSATKAAANQIVPRLALIFFLQVLWSGRLTFHAIRRGFFKKGEEDYRWPVLREKLPRWAWELLALFFIAIAQNILLALTALPQYMILTSTWSKLNKPAHPADELNKWDFLVAGLTIVNLSLEMLSDQQQWTYQNYKRGKDASLNDFPPAKVKMLKEEADVKRGFLTKGLWRYSRHPNFFCEQINWWLFWSYVVITFTPAKGPVPWSTFLKSYATLSPVLMNLLFISSTAFTEQITGGKYPAYKAYQKRVGMFLPLDTFIRGLYYRFIASADTRKRVEDDVWGNGPSVKSK